MEMSKSIDKVLEYITNRREGFFTRRCILNQEWNKPKESSREVGKELLDTHPDFMDILLKEVLEEMEERDKQYVEKYGAGIFEWITPYTSLNTVDLYILNKCIMEKKETGKVVFPCGYDYFWRLLCRHHHEFMVDLANIAYSINLGKVTLYNAREALHSTQSDFNLDEDVFIFKESSFFDKGELVKFKNISSMNARRTIVKSSRCDEPIFIVKFTGIKAEDLATRYKKEVGLEDFTIYEFVMLMLEG